VAFVRLIAIAKDEAAYLAEWVHHHLHFGFDQIAVVLNDCTDNSRQLLEQIANSEPRLLVRDGNALKASCQQTGQNFQITAYAQELALARQDSRVTHVMCLDIDEFWVTPGLTDTIHSYTDRYPKADSIAFAWHMEVPSNPEPFRHALQASYPVQKDRHVKSIHRISDRLTYLDIHNAIHQDGNYLLADGREFPQHTHNGSERAGLPDELFEAAQVDCAFVYHRVFRSQQEYLASLQRGRPGPSAHSLKTNRWGYQSHEPSAPVLLVTHPEKQLHTLHSSCANFAHTHQLENGIAEGQQHAHRRFQTTLAAMASGAKEVQQLAYLFHGITLPELADLHALPAHIAHHIDSITATESGFVVKGWVIDKNSERSVCLTLPAELHASVTRLARPDVVRHYPGTHTESGFRIDITQAPSTHIDITFRCGHTCSTNSLTLPAPTA
jgi:hypothetical protein